MKNLLLIATCLFAGIATAQLSNEERSVTIEHYNNSFCKTIPYDQLLKGEKVLACTYGSCESELELYDHAPIEDLQVKTFPVRVVIFSDDDGSNTVTNQAMEDHFEVVNTAFLQARVQFEIVEIANVASTVPNHADLDAWSEGSTFYGTYGEGQDEQFNVFVINDMQGDSNGMGQPPFPLFGDTLDPDFVGCSVITSDLINTSLPVNEQQGLTHELGHNLGLFHPFQAGFICDDECREKIDPNGTNGEGLDPYNTGDFLKDTHPMPFVNVFFGQEDDCDFLTSQTFEDHCSDLEFAGIENLVGNIMNYFDCKETFTDEQILRMHCIATDYYDGYYTTGPLAVSENISDTYAIYPNPAGNNFTIDLGGAITSSFQLYNLQGKVVLEQDIINKQQIALPTQVANGLYILRIKTD